MFDGIPRYTPGIDARLTNQHNRIQDGLNDGTISAEEQQKIQQGGQAFRGMLAGSKADDGVIDVSERLMMHRALNKGSKMIYDFKHNQ